MKKKSLITMLVALTLVAAVGIGSTLAYLSSTTTVMKNTFSVGKVSITQDESDESTEDKTDRTSKGNEYTDIQPGDELVKDPTVTVLAKSSDCYVFMQVAGIDALEQNGFKVGAFDAAWTKVSEGNGKDGLYVYSEGGVAKVVTKDNADQKLPALFKNVTYDITNKELAAGVTLSDITIKSCAVQSANMGDGNTTPAKAAQDAAVTEMNK